MNAAPFTRFDKNKVSREIKHGIFFGLAQSLKTEPMSLSDFFREAWPIVEPINAYQHNWHIDAIGEYLTSVTIGQIQRLVINIYPRVGKSLLASVLWPAWAWSQRPWLRQIFLSYSGRLSTGFSRDRRTVITSEWYKSRWGNLFQMAPDQNQKGEFENTARGTMYATSVGGTLTGEGGDIIVIDDGIDPERAESKADRDAAIRFVKNTVGTRLNDVKRGAIVEISQRTHKNDISGTLLEEGGYVHLNLPAIAEKKTIIEFPVSHRQIVREEGEALFPQRHTAAQINDIKGRMTPRAASAQFDQKPRSDETALFKADKWKFYSLPPDEMAKNMTQLIQSWDFAFKDLATSSRVAGGVIGYKGADFYLFDVVCRHMGFTASKTALKSLTSKWPAAHTKLIEDKANGPAIIESSRAEVGGVIPYSPKDSKGARAAVVASYQEAGNLYLPDPKFAPWVNDFISECDSFTGNDDDEFNDQVDMFTQGINWFLERKRNQPFFVVAEE